MHAEPSHWLHEISISKSVGHHFWPGLMAGSVIWGHNVPIAVWDCRPGLLQTIFLVKPSPMCFQSYFAAMIFLSAFLSCFHDSDLAAQNVKRFSESICSKLFFILRQCSVRIPVRELTISVGGPELIINNHLPTLQFIPPKYPTWRTDNHSMQV